MSYQPRRLLSPVTFSILVANVELVGPLPIAVNNVVELYNSTLSRIICVRTSTYACRSPSYIDEQRTMKVEVCGLEQDWRASGLSVLVIIWKQKHWASYHVDLASARTLFFTCVIFAGKDRLFFIQYILTPKL